MWRPRRRTVLALAVAIVLLLLTPSAQAAIERACTIHLLAVTKGGGIVLDVDLMLRRPGRGLIVVEPVGTVDLDTKVSSELATLYALLAAHKDPLTYDILVKFPSTSERISGASGSGFVALALLTLVRGVELPPDVSLTGMLTPVGLLAPVKGLREKVLAASRRGITTVFVPAVQLNLAHNLKVENLTIRGACSVDDALIALSGRHLSISRIEVDLTQDLEAAFSKDARYFASLAKRMLNVCKADKLVEELIREADTAYKEGEYYSAASLAFYAINLMVSEDEHCAEKLKTLLDVRLDKLMDAIAKTASRYVRHVGYVKLSELEGLASFALRAYMAEGMALKKGVLSYVRAVLRALTALSWYNLTSKAEGAELPLDAVRTAAAYMLRLALVSRQYLEALGLKNLTMPDGRSIGSWLSDARSAFVKGDLYNYAKSIAISAYILAYTSTLMYAGAGIGSKEGVDCAIKTIKMRIARQLLEMGTTSVVAALLSRYAERLTPLDAGAAIAVACHALAWTLIVDALVTASEAQKPVTLLKSSAAVPSDIATLATITALCTAVCWLYIRFARKEIEQRYSL